MVGKLSRLIVVTDRYIYILRCSGYVRKLHRNDRFVSNFVKIVNVRVIYIELVNECLVI